MTRTRPGDHARIASRLATHFTARIASLALLGATACTETIVADPPVAVEMAVVAGGTPVTQSVVTIVPTAPAVRVTNSAGEPFAGAQVLFVATRGGGTVTGASVTTGSDGIATVGSWRFGSIAGPQELAVAVVNSTSDANLVFTGTALPGPTAALSVIPAQLTLLPGGTRQLSVNAVDAYGNVTGTGVVATYTSQDPAIVTVSPSGLVTAVGFGSTSVVASYLGQSASASVGVGTRPVGDNVVNSALFSRPFAVATSPQGTAYVVRVDAADVTRFDLPLTGAANTTPMAAPAYDIVFLPTGNVAYAVNTPGGALSVIDRSTNAVLRTIGSIGEPYRITPAPNGAFVYVTTSTGALHRISTADDSKTTLALGIGPANGLVINPSRDVLYVSSYTGVVVEMSLTTFTVTRSLGIPGQLQDLAVSPDGATLYVANESGGLAVVNTASFTVSSTLAAVSGGFDVALTADGIELYVTRPLSGLVTVINTQTLGVARSFGSGTPRRMALSADGLTLLIANESGWVTFVR